MKEAILSSVLCHTSENTKDIESGELVVVVIMIARRVQSRVFDDENCGCGDGRNRLVKSGVDNEVNGVV